MKIMIKIAIALTLIIQSLACFGQRAVTIGLQGGINGGYSNAYLINNGNIWVTKEKVKATPKIGMFVDVPARGNFHLQLGVDIASIKTEIEGSNIGTVFTTDVDGQIEKPGDVYVKYNYTATELLHLKYLRLPIYATYHLRFNSRFKLIYGLGAAYGFLLKMENKAVTGPQLISNRKFADHDLVLSAFHAAEVTFFNQWGIRFGVYFDQGIIDIDGGTMQDVDTEISIPKVYSRNFGINVGLTYNFSKPLAK